MTRPDDMSRPDDLTLAGGMNRSDERMRGIVQQLQQDPALVEQLPDPMGEVARAALDGRTIYEIAQQQHTSEDAVWQLLSNAARMAAGRPVERRVETSGLGSDTDPGVTGGYGETGFGSLGNEPPIATPEEPTDQD